MLVLRGLRLRILWLRVAVLRRGLRVLRRVLAARIRAAGIAIGRCRIRLLGIHVRGERQREHRKQRAKNPSRRTGSLLRGKLVGERLARHLVHLGEEPR